MEFQQLRKYINRQNLDIILGIVAWIIAITGTIIFWIVLYFSEFSNWTITFVWLLCVSLMLMVTERKFSFFWWVWWSFPLAIPHITFLGLSS